MNADPASGSSHDPPPFAVARAVRAQAALLRSGLTPGGIGLALWEQRSGGTLCYRAPGHHTFSLYLRGGHHVRADTTCGARANATGSPGAICLIPRGSVTRWRNRGLLRWLHVYFGPAHWDRALGGPAPDPSLLAFACDPALREMVERFVLALDWSDPSDAAALDHALMALLARGPGLERRTDRIRAPAGGLTGAQRRAVEEVVRDRLSGRIAVAELAEVAGLGVRQFSRAFAASTGMAPYDFVLRQRLEAARAMLAAGRSATDAAAACGFSSQSHLIRRFRAVFGYTPGAMRQARGPRAGSCRTDPG